MLTLHQFVSSHFNEKVRWALDYKEIPHVRESYLPGPHAPLIKKLSGGPTTTPLLQHDHGYISGSAAIIDFLEHEYPEPWLYPADESQRAKALSIQERFDAVVGPATRTVVFNVFVNEGAYLCATFSAPKPWLKRVAYRALFPLAKPLISKANGVNPENVEKCLQTTRDALDEVVSMTAPTGYMVGDAFSIADLTVASLLMPLVNVDHPDTRRVEPMPDSLATFLAQWQPHPAIAWVREIYAKHRPVVALTGAALEKEAARS
ncbi:MAG: glutathione S-transferase family protein [Pseudomonadota bacterium]